MARIINISDRLDNTKPTIVIGTKEYQVNDSLETMVKMQELITEIGSIEKCEKAVEVALGNVACKEINVKSYSFKNYRVLIAGILAAIQDTEDVDAILARFQTEETNGT